MERFVSPVTTVLALYGLYQICIDFNLWRFVNWQKVQQNPVIQRVEKKVADDLQKVAPLQPSEPSPTPITPSPSPSPWVGGGANIQTPFFSGEYQFKVNGKPTKPTPQPTNK
ncbi:MAG: hypothetical protein ACM37W_00300 [Actinomycetota bacterium]